MENQLSNIDDKTLTQAIQIKSQNAPASSLGNIDDKTLMNAVQIKQGGV